MKLLPTLFYIVVSSAGNSLSPLQGRIPQTVEELWSNYDPRREALEIEVIRQWEEDSAVIRYVRYLIGTFKGVPAQMAAFYAFPKSGKQLPGILQMHGGGQRASLTEVKYYASRGYAALSVNWGGVKWRRPYLRIPIPIGEPSTPPKIMCLVISVYSQMKNIWIRLSLHATATGFY